MFTKTAVSVLALAAAALGQNLVVNPGFDLDAQNDSPPVGWTTSDTASDFVDGTFYQSPAFSWIFGSADPSTLSQTITAAVPGQCYLLSFYALIEENPLADATNTGLSVSFGNLDYTVPILSYPQAPVSPVGPQPDANWVQSSLYALATADNTLTFTGFANYYINIDTVSLTATNDITPCLAASQRARTRRTKRHSHQAQW